MSVNKNALIRYKVLDSCFRNHAKKYFIEDLIDELVSKRNKTQKDKDNLDLLRIKLGQLRNG